MKKSTLILLCFALLAWGALRTQGQDAEEKTTSEVVVKEEDEPIMYKFEPNYLESVADRKETIQRTRAVLDTMDISEGKRRRLLKDLYKNGITERLTKAMMADSKFEDVDQD